MKFWSFAAFVLASTVAALSANAQCEPDWLPGNGIPGIDGTVYALKNWDPDGAGPLPSLVVAAGTFNTAGEASAKNIAAWDGTRWNALGLGVNQTAYSLAVSNTNELIVGGDFTTAGTVPANRIAKWNGTSWSAVGTGANSTVRALAVASSGDIIAGGSFSQVGGNPISYIARWNGSAWSALGTAPSPRSRKRQLCTPAAAA